MDELKNLLVIISVVVAILISASLPWLIILAYGFRALAEEMERTQFTSGLGNTYVILLIIAMISSALILYFLISWVSRNKNRWFNM